MPGPASWSSFEGFGLSSGVPKSSRSGFWFGSTVRLRIQAALGLLRGKDAGYSELKPHEG